jgi:hypothetical protein
MLTVTNAGGFGRTPPPPATVAYVSSGAQTPDQTAYTFSGQAIGTAAANRRVVVGTSVGGDGSKPLNTVTVGGISAIDLGQSGVTSPDLLNNELWMAVVPSGTTADIVLTFAASQSRVGIGVWAVGTTQTGASDTLGVSVDSGGSAGGTIDCPAGGVIIGVHTVRAATTFTWTGIDEDFETNVDGTVLDSSGASKAFAATQSSLSVDANPAGGSQMTAFFVSIAP